MSFCLTAPTVFRIPISLAGKNLSIAILYQPYFLFGIALLTILVSVVAGGHPAFFLTSFKPAVVLKGKLQSQLKGRGLRESLVVFQFCVSIGMIICTLLVYKQVQFLQSQDLGFNKEDIIRKIGRASCRERV